MTTGGLVNSGVDLDADDTYARMAADELVRFGAPRGVVQAVPAATTRQDRTYASAVAVRHWLAANHSAVKSLDVVTLGPHARRTRLMYQQALGAGVAVGVIALEDHGYDPDHWWRSSEGFKEVVGETIAYLYAWILFVPER